MAVSNLKTSNAMGYFPPGLLSVVCVVTHTMPVSQGAQATLGLGERLCASGLSPGSVRGIEIRW